MHFMTHKTILILLAIFISLTATAIPARKGLIPLTQPDGTTFNAVFRGDESVRIKTTTDGRAIIQDEEGWWCYAEFDETGRRWSSGWRVGGKAPQEILSRSMEIPYRKVAQLARFRNMHEDGRLASIPGKAVTRNGETAIKHGIVILAQFKDVSFKHSRSDFEALLTQEGYSEHGAIGSAKEYFDAQFGGKAEFIFDVSDVVTLPGARKDYGANDESGQDTSPEMMIMEACRLADADIDFSIYDDDSDGEIDNVFVFFAGEDEAEGAAEECIWSHAWYIYNGAGYNMSLDGKRLNRYACTSELTRLTVADGKTTTMAGIGTFCHEFSHTLGLPDLYDTDYEESGGEAAALWQWTALMHGGNHNGRGQVPPYFNAIEREILGLCSPEVIDSDGTYTLEPVHIGGKAYRIDTDHPDEYFLLECRSGERWDSKVGGSGMLIYHIDKSDRNSGYSDYYGYDITALRRWTVANEVNCRPDHQCADLLEADGRQDSFSAEESELFRSSLSSINGIFFPYSGTDSITPDGKPGLTYWSGEKSKATITNIRWENGKVTFSVIGFSEFTTPPEVKSISHEAFPDAAIINFESDKAFDGNAVVSWGRTGKEMESMTVRSYEPGKFAAVLEGLEPGNKTYTVTVAFEIGGVLGKSESTSFMTKKNPAVDWPFIFMNNVGKTESGRIAKGARLPLRLGNASDAASISWTFNGSPVTAGGDGYFKVSENGTLKAEIIFPDGAETVIIKEIVTE